MARSRLGLILAVGLTGTLGTPLALPADPPAETTATISRSPLTAGLHIDAMPLSKVISHFSRLTGANIVVNWHALTEIGVAKDTPISLDLEHVTFRKALQMVLDQASPGSPLTWNIEDNVLEITTQAEADKILVTRLYVVTDLVMVSPSVGTPPALNLSTTTVTVNSGSSSGGSNSSTGTVFSQTDTSTAATPTDTPQTRADELISLITSVIRPEIWVTNGGTSTIRYFSGKLVITAPESVQYAIGGNTGLRIGR